MNVQLVIKVSIGVTAVVIWVTAVWLNLSPVEPLVSACQAALVGLGVYHVK